MYKGRSQIKRIIAFYIQTLHKLGIKVERVILYGSYVRGEQKRESDIDLVVISRDFEKMSLRERIELLGIAAARIKEPIEARGYTPEEIENASPASFLKEVLRVGVTV